MSNYLLKREYLINIIYLNKPNAWLLVVGCISYIKYVPSLILGLIRGKRGRGGLGEPGWERWAVCVEWLGPQSWRCSADNISPSVCQPPRQGWQKRERERERKRAREKNAMKKEKLIERKHVKGRGSAWTSGSSEYGKPPLRFCPLKRIEGTASPLAGKSRGPGFSQRNAATIKGARRPMLGARRSQSGCLHTEGIQAWIKGA